MALFYTYSGNVYGTGSAGQTTFALTSSAGNPIPYLLPAHIHVSTSINDQQTWVELARPADWDFDAQGTSVVLTNPLPVATELRVQRITPTDEPFVDFQASSLLTAEQLNEGEEFSLYVDQELRDAVAIDLSGALIYKGTVDLTADNAPLNPANGWTLYNTGAGTVIQGGTPGWDGIVGLVVEGGEQVIFDGAQWEIAPERPDGVVVVNGTAPITVDSTDAQRPVVGITDATTSAAGAMSAADKTKLDGIETGAQVNVATDLGYTAAASTGVVSSSTGTDATIPAATTTEAGLLTGADKTKLDGIATGAQPGTVTEVTGTAPIAVATGTTTPVVSISEATETATGSIELATQAEVDLGTDDARAVTPLKLATRLVDFGTGFLPLTGGNLTGGVTATERTVTAGAFDLDTGNFWTAAAIDIPNPTNAVAGMSGLIRLTGVPTSWDTNFTNAPTAVTAPSIIPFYVESATVIRLGAPVVVG